MKKLFSMGVTIHATAYVLADSEEEAVAKCREACMDSAIYLSDRRQEAGDMIITGETYSPDMPEVSLSPAMTVGEVDAKSVDLAEDFEPEDEDNECGQCEGTGTIEGGLGGDGDDEECPVCDGSGELS